MVGDQTARYGFAMTVPPVPAQPALTTRVWAQLAFLGAIWGGFFFFARVAVMEIHPLMLVFLRVAIAAAALHVYLLARGPSFRQALPLAPGLLLLGFVNNVVPFSLIFFGQTELGAGAAAVLNATTPFWTLLLANTLTTDEKLSARKLVGVLLGIAGTAVMIGPGLIAGLGGPAWAKFALVGAALSYAVALIVARRFRGVPPTLIATGQLTASSIMMLPVALIAGAPTLLADVSGGVWLAVLALALLSTSIGYIVFFRIVAAAGATNASLVTLLVPVSAILLGLVFLGEALEVFELAGMALIFLGLLVIDGRILRRALRTSL